MDEGMDTNNNSTLEKQNNISITQPMFAKPLGHFENLSLC